MRWVLYNTLFTVAFAARLPGYLLRMARRGGYRRGFLQRIGVFPAAVREQLAAGGRVWIHAVSVGEAFVAFRLMDAARQRRPDTRFLLTVNTSTAHRIAESRLCPERDLLLYFPVDTPPVVRRWLRCVRPSALLLVECELWPNLIRLAADTGVFIGLVNGRLSPASARGYRWIAGFIRPVLARIDAACMQSDGDRGRLLSLGARPECARTVGSMKYETAEPDPSAAADVREVLRAAGLPADAMLLLGGSTWPGEEEVLLDLYAALKPDFPKLALGLAPRHAERAPGVADAVAGRGLAVVRRSRLAPPADARPPDVFLLDTTGELFRFYAAADLVFIGKSLTARGGQNPIEPAAWGKPVLCGPHMQNFPIVMADFLEAGALVQVADAQELEREARRLLRDPAARRELGRRAEALVRARRGATQRTLAFIEAAGLRAFSPGDGPTPPDPASAEAPAARTGGSPGT